MLGVGFKQTDTSTQSLLTPLQEYVKKEYATSSTTGEAALGITAEHQEALDRFLQLRSDVSLVRTASNISRHVLLSYFAQLSHFEKRFPSCDASTSSSATGTPLRLQFTWYDSFCPRKKLTQPSVKFEQAAVMFNFGAHESQLGVQTDRSAAEGLKAACKHFMEAAGAFSLVREKLIEQCLGSRTPDMSSEGLGMLVQLMLAQAQACFYEKSIKDQMKDAIKAKLVHQALEFYSGALEYANSTALKGTIDPTWGHHIQFQVFCMKAATQYWEGKASKEMALARGVGYGQEITRLMAADAECQEAIKWATQNRLPASLIASVKKLQNTIQENLATAKKDNASVYLENIPKFSDLPVVGKACMVKAIVPSLEEVEKEIGKEDFFERFVSGSLIKLAAQVKEDVAQLLKQTSEKSHSENECAKRKLHELGLPASIEAFESGDGIPVTIWQKIEFIQHQVGPNSDAVNAIHVSIAGNKRAAKETERKLGQIESLLSQEEIEDNVCRQNYGSKWSRPVSSTLSQSFRSDVDRYYRLLREAKNSDKLLMEKAQSKEHAMSLLMKSKAELDVEVPARDSATHGHDDVDVSLLSVLLMRLSELIQEREKVLEDFGHSVDNMNAVPAMMASSNTLDVNQAIEHEKRFFEDHFVNKIGDISREQEQLLDEIVKENERFEMARQKDVVVIQREKLMQQLGDAIETFEQLSSNCQEGKKFYSDLDLRVSQLLQTVQDHCSARDLERKEMELNYAQDEATLRQQIQDADLAQRMASSHISDPRTQQLDQDAAYAAQLAGNVPQDFGFAGNAPYPNAAVGSPPSYEYARLQANQQRAQAPRSPSVQPAPLPANHPYYNYQMGGNTNLHDPNYQQQSPYTNYYQQQQQPPPPQQSYQQPPAHQQYPGNPNLTPGNPRSAYGASTSAGSGQNAYPGAYGGDPNFPRSPPGSSV